MIGSSNLSRNFFQSGSRGSGVSRLAPKRLPARGDAPRRRGRPRRTSGSVLRSSLKRAHGRSFGTMNATRREHAGRRSDVTAVAVAAGIRLLAVRR